MTRSSGRRRRSESPGSGRGRRYDEYGDQYGEAANNLKKAGYLWLLQAAIGGLICLFVMAAYGVILGILAGLFFVGVPVGMYYGLKGRSKGVWVVHMVLSVLSLGSLVGFLMLYFGWKGREAALN